MAKRRYRALLIGNSHYDNLPDLKGPINDVSRLATTLSDRRIGLFDPTEVTLLTERASHEIIAEFESFLRDSMRNEVLLVYFSGHGLPDARGSLLLCGRNAHTASPRSTTVAASVISELIDDCPSTVIIILDCCYSGAFKSGSLVEELAGNDELTGNGRFVLTSTRAREKARDADDATGLSPFTAHLLRGIGGEAATRDNDYISISDLYRYVYRMMAQDRRAIPERRFSGDGDIAIARCAHALLSQPVQSISNRDGSPENRVTIPAIPEAVINPPETPEEPAPWTPHHDAPWNQTPWTPDHQFDTSQVTHQTATLFNNQRFNQRFTTAINDLHRWQERRRTFRVLGRSAGGVLAVGLIVGIWVLSGLEKGSTDTPSSSPLPTSEPVVTPSVIASPLARPVPLPATVDCQYPPGSVPTKPVTPPRAGTTPAKGNQQATLQTSEGSIKLTLHRALAPCTVHSFLSLAQQGFYNDSSCHRLVTDPALQVLQCGDPTGQGNGGPGYTIPDEVFPEMTYERGYVAMANTGQPDSGGSQFFMIYGNAQLPPTYTVFGIISPAGLEIIDNIVRAGHDASLDPSPGGGKPNKQVTITSVDIAT